MWIEIPDIEEPVISEEELLLNSLYNSEDVIEIHNTFKAKNNKEYIHFTVVSSKTLNKKVKIKYKYEEIIDLETGECIGMFGESSIKEKDIKLRIIK